MVDEGYLLITVYIHVVFWILCMLWFVIVCDLSEYRHRNDITGKLSFFISVVNTNLIYASGLCDKFFVLTKFWPNVSSITEQTHGNLIFVLTLMAW